MCRRLGCSRSCRNKRTEYFRVVGHRAEIVKRAKQKRVKVEGRVTNLLGMLKEQLKR